MSSSVEEGIYDGDNSARASEVSYDRFLLKF